MNTDNKARLIEELKPCPFCGGEAELKTIDENVKDPVAWVQCKTCDVLMDWNWKESTVETVVASWNRRIEAAGLLAGSVGVLPTYEQLFMALYDGFGFIDPKACDTITKTALAIIEGKFTSLTRSPEPKGRWMEMLEEAYRVLKEAPDDIAMPALRIMAIQPLGMALEALRSAPRAKEE